MTALMRSVLSVAAMVGLFACNQQSLLSLDDAGVVDGSAEDGTGFDAQADSARILSVCVPCNSRPPDDCESFDYSRSYEPSTKSCGQGLCKFETNYRECGYGCMNGACVTHSDEWLPMTTVGAPTPRVNHVAVWTGSEMVVWGGRGENGVLGDGAAYNPKTDSWRPIPLEGAPSPREGHSAFLTLSNEITVWGGRNGDHYFDNGAIYSVAINQWRPIKPTFEDLNPPPPTARAYHRGIFVWGSRPKAQGITFPTMVVIGGRCADEELHSNPGIFDYMFGIWLNQPNAGTIKADVIGHTAIFAPPYVATMGGVNRDGSYNEADVLYDPFADSSIAINPWKEGDTAMFPRKFHTSTWIGNHFVVWGGQPKDSKADPRLTGHFFPNANQWLSGTSTNAPAARMYHTSLWDFRNMIVWGGLSLEDPKKVLDSGGIYNYKAPAWRAIPLAGAPSPRQKHSAIWTTADPGSRTEMIVWGGLSGPEDDWATRPLNTGGRYATP